MAVVAACAPPATSSSIVVFNQDTHPAQVDVVGPTVTGAEVAPCDGITLFVDPGIHTVTVRTSAGVARLPVEVVPGRDGQWPVLGIDAVGGVGRGRPPENPTCRNQ